jgi:putative toxin-antitoxin system antitoxin component (TIGR02293 family)
MEDLMATVAREAAATSEGAELQRVADLLGLRRKLRSALDVHEALVHGLPGAALTHLIGKLATIHSASLEKAVGMSVRTFQRRRGAPAKPLSQEQSGRTWKFAEVLAKATAVLGSQEAAEQWLERPAIGLDQRRPIDLLTTPAGTRLVEDYLTRIDYGVYT